jgi:uncharacterized protein YyaL (SSP411 family)
MNRMTAISGISKALLAGALGGHKVLENALHIRLAAEWLAAAQDATPDGGVSAEYSFREGWDSSYPETTGYISRTLFDYYHLTQQEVWRDRATRMLDWLLTTQLDSGAFPLRTDLATPMVFDTGQAILGLVSAYRETGARRYLVSAVIAGQWLVAIQEPTGAWLQHSYGGIGHTYHTRVAWALLELYQESDDDTLLAAATKNLSWGLSQQLENGWFQNNAFSADDIPILHTIAYAARGLLEAGRILERPEYTQAATRTADALLDKLRDDGFLSGKFDQDWASPVRWSCLTGNAQTAIIWLKLYQLTGNDSYLRAAQKANLFLKKTQNVEAKNQGVRGGIKGSHPIHGGYMPYSYPNWATKFFLDALILEEAVTGSSTVQAPEFSVNTPGETERG